MLLRLPLSLLFTAGLVWAAPQDAATLKNLLQSALERSAQASPEEAVAQGHAVIALASDETREDLRNELDKRLKDSEQLPEPARLLLLAARLKLGEADLARIGGELSALVGSTNEAVARVAARTAADTRLRTLREDDLQELVDALRVCAKNASREPATRIQAAVGLHLLGRADGQREGRGIMLSFLDSSDPSLRAAGALALAEVGDIETSRKILEGLASLPSTEGRLAAAYLKQEDIRRIYDRRTKALLEGQNEAEGDPKAAKDLAILERLIRLIQTNALEGPEVKRQDLIDAACDGMLGYLDEHSSFMAPKAFKKFEQDLLSAEYGGIGAYVGEDPEDKIFTITRPIYSGPAYRAGLHTDDKIVRIDDWPTITNSGSHPLDDIIKRLKGKPGTQVKLYIWRRGMDPALVERPTEDMAVTVTREEITIPPVTSIELPGKVGLIELSTFSRVASDEIEKRLKVMLADGMRGVILDLRNNSGGLLEEARAVCELFLEKGKLVVTTEGASRSEKLYTERDPLVPMDMPLVVLVNRFSASASEIVSGALQDHRRALIVGQRSYGKGSVQNLLPIQGEFDDRFQDENGNRRYDPWEKLTKDWNGNGEFDFAPRARLTIAHYHLPSGRSIHREIDSEGVMVSEGGVEPDLKSNARRIDGWRAEEMVRLVRRDKLIREYVMREYPTHKDRFRELAEGDGDDLSRYPNFRELYDSLETPLSEQDVRMLVRNEVRRRVQDDRGEAFPDGDFQEDLQLQAAIRAILEQVGDTPESIPLYRVSFDPTDEKTGQRPLLAKSGDEQRTRLNAAIQALESLRAKGNVDQQTADELQKALEGALRGALGQGDEPR